MHCACAFIPSAPGHSPTYTMLCWQDPTCAKLTILGQLKRVPQDGVAEAEGLLFSRHPAMRSWPVGHAFHM